MEHIRKHQHAIVLSLKDSDIRCPPPLFAHLVRHRRLHEAEGCSPALTPHVCIPAYLWMYTDLSEPADGYG